MLILLAIVPFVLILAVIGAFGYHFYVKPSRMLDQLTFSDQNYSTVVSEKKRDRSEVIADILRPIGTLLPLSPQDTSLVRRELIAAGIRSESAVQVFFGLKLILAVVLLGVALFFRSQIANPILRLVCPIAGAGIGYILPSFLLGRRIDRRNDEIRLSLPDVLDLLVICTEAGCGLDQALVNVSRELKSTHAAVSEELTIVNMEIMAGTTRAEALRSFARRVAEDEIKKLVAMLIQTDRFGTSVADALRTQSDYLRIRRRQEAEERAGKVGVKLVFPIFFFCLPSLLVVTAGAGILQLVHNVGSINGQ
jgi:tight adherence protein C